MELEITQEKENGLFDRKEIQGLISAEIAPKREDVLKVLAERFSVPIEVIKIKGIHGKFGLQEFKLEANIYKSKEDKDQVEIKKKKEIEAEKKAAEASKAEGGDSTTTPATAPQEASTETPAEETKEEAQAKEVKEEAKNLESEFYNLKKNWKKNLKSNSTNG